MIEKDHNVTPQEGDTIAVWFSCGANSAVAAKRTLEKYGGTCTVRIVNNPVVEEHPDNIRFLKDCEKWFGQEIETAINPKFPSASAVEVWEKQRYMSGVAGAPCTKLLKKRARQHWETENKVDWHVLGFSADERKRFDRFILTERSNVLPILIEDDLTKPDCLQIVKEAGIDPPAIYSMGFPNANCIGCVKSQSVKYWRLVRNTFPEVFKSRAEQSRKIGARLLKVKGRRLFLDELPDDVPDDRMPLDFECGIFCEEKV